MHRQQDPASTTVRVGLIGRGIQKSRTPGMHEAEGQAQGMTYRYDLFDTAAGTPDDLAGILDRAEAEGYAGLNVTYPYKRAVMALLDTLSPNAERVGAVNTVVFRNGRRQGHNTDAWGFAEGFRRGLPGAGLDRVLLLGAGGAGGAVAHALVDLGARRLLIRDTARPAAEALVASINAHAGAEIARVTEDGIAEADGIVNATPVGMLALPGTPLDPSALSPHHWVADIVYVPLATALLTAAAARGCRVLSGEGMAVFQAVRAFELFTGRPADPERMRATFHRLGAAAGVQASGVQA
ncbi:shikimate dehydrogenase [Pararhodobacter aggregans]